MKKFVDLVLVISFYIFVISALTLICYSVYHIGFYCLILKHIIVWEPILILGIITAVFFILTYIGYQYESDDICYEEKGRKANQKQKKEGV